MYHKAHFLHKISARLSVLGLTCWEASIWGLAIVLIGLVNLADEHCLLCLHLPCAPAGAALPRICEGPSSGLLLHKSAQCMG